VYAYFTKCLVDDHEIKVLKAGWRYFVHHHLRELAKSLLRRRTAAPLWLVLDEIRGVFYGPFAYLRTRSADRDTPFAVSATPEEYVSAANLPDQLALAYTESLNVMALPQQHSITTVKG